MPRKLTLTLPTTSIIDEAPERSQHNNSDILDNVQNVEEVTDGRIVDKETVKMQSETSSQSNSSLNQSISHYSKLSRVTMDITMYKNIFREREAHNVFSSIEDNTNCNQWFYKLNDDTVEGPHSSFEMDQKFKNDILSENTKIKREVDDEYFPLKRLVRRYYNNVLAKKTKNTYRESNLSSKKIRFRKTTMNSTKRCKPEKLEITGREERVVSALPRPKFTFYNNCTNSSDEDDSEPCTPRIRSQTLAN